MTSACVARPPVNEFDKQYRRQQQLHKERDMLSELDNLPTVNDRLRAIYASDDGSDDDDRQPSKKKTKPSELSLDDFFGESFDEFAKQEIKTESFLGASSFQILKDKAHEKFPGHRFDKTSRYNRSRKRARLVDQLRSWNQKLRVWKKELSILQACQPWDEKLDMAEIEIKGVCRLENAGQRERNTSISDEYRNKRQSKRQRHHDLDDDDDALEERFLNL